VAEVCIFCPFCEEPVRQDLGRVAQDGWSSPAGRARLVFAVLGVLGTGGLAGLAVLLGTSRKIPSAVGEVLLAVVACTWLCAYFIALAKHRREPAARQTGTRFLLEVVFLVGVLLSLLVASCTILCGGLLRHLL
jgi:hypothetical protein